MEDTEEINGEGGRTSYKTLYEDAKRELLISEGKLSQLTKEKTELETTIEEKEEEIVTLGETLKESDTNAETLKKNLKEKDTQIQRNELRRFSASFAKQEGEYKTNQDSWFNYSIYTTVFLVISIAFSIVAPLKEWSTGSWYEQPGFYFMNIIFLTLFIYALKQHSFFGSLRVDYANRKTLAQSYQHIVEDEEDEEIRADFLKNIVGILASNPNTQKDAVTIWEYLLEMKKPVEKEVTTKTSKT